MKVSLGMITRTIPTAHVLQAALHVAGIIDSGGSGVTATRVTYIHYPTGGIFPPDDLTKGEELLIACGLLQFQEGILLPSDELRALVSVPVPDATESLLSRVVLSLPANPFRPDREPGEALNEIEETIPDPQRREDFLMQVKRHFDDKARAWLGEQGEEAVVRALRSELEGLDRPELASRVRRVSLLSDQLGYDVVAPRIGAGARRLEVKTTAEPPHATLRVYLTRNETDVGQREEDWALVVCAMGKVPLVEILGWCRAHSLKPYLPVDSPGSKWREAELSVPRTLLIPGVPPAL